MSGAAPAPPAVDLTLDGPSEDAWERVAERLPAWAADELPGRRLVVIAPHPDDESLGVGGTIALLARRLPVVVVCVTDGEAAPSALPHEELAAVRRAELLDAVGALAGAAEIVRLGLPDGALGPVADDLTERLAALVGAEDLVLSTLDGDGHPDHDAVGRAARAATGRHGATHLWFPVWAWHWHDPARSIIRRGRRIDLDPAAQDAKAAAVGRYRSQLGGAEPVVPAGHVRRCLRPFEVVIPS